MLTDNQPAAITTMLYAKLEVVDPEIHKLVERERQRQFRGLELIASENFTSVAVMEANGSILTNKYSEGLPGARYYGGNEHIDALELLCQQRALTAFRLNPAEWGVNVQPYSGSTANFAALTGLVGPHERIMGLDLPSGGHLTHGYQTAKRKISSTSIFFESLPYQVDPVTGLVDYEKLAENARLFHPKVLICGASAYPREWDYARLRVIADEHGAYLMMDMAHISGLVAAQEAEDPFKYCDIVTTTTHKTLRGPRAGLVFFRKLNFKGENTGLEERINFAIFPSTQGGPHNNTIAGVAVALKQAATPEFRTYSHAVCENAKALAIALASHGYKIASGGTDNHIVLWDLRPLKLTGSKVEKICEMANITINKNSVPGDHNAISPGGVRLGTAALTTRGFTTEHFVTVAQLLHQAIQISIRIQSSCGSKMLKDFIAAAQGDPEIAELKASVEGLATVFPMPGM
jgi:glycine hydroxymethyltransferase